MTETAIIIINLFSFALCVYDKIAAKLGGYRIPEKVLLGLAALFGSGGMLAGMYLFRHKTNHKSFMICVPLFLVAHVAILVITGVIKVKT